MIKRILIILAIGSGLITTAYADGGHKGNGNHGSNASGAVSTKVQKKTVADDKIIDSQEVSGKAKSNEKNR
ncbi:hypothetical protein [Chitinibacter sp. S2-10]|uniref:hypothetical protein n=1 Tax=Chitinibacter sp. S2-10 TaxID=3373597 RepID=UPI003977650F